MGVCGNPITDSSNLFVLVCADSLSFHSACSLIHMLVRQINTFSLLFIPHRYTMNLQNRAALTEILTAGFYLIKPKQVPHSGICGTIPKIQEGPYDHS